jgi:hypothetical protein
VARRRRFEWVVVRRELEPVLLLPVLGSDAPGLLPTLPDPLAGGRLPVLGLPVVPVPGAPVLGLPLVPLPLPLPVAGLEPYDPEVVSIDPEPVPLEPVVPVDPVPLGGLPTVGSGLGRVGSGPGVRIGSGDGVGSGLTVPGDPAPDEPDPAVGSLVVELPLFPVLLLRPCWVSVPEGEVVLGAPVAGDVALPAPVPAVCPRAR